jgi:hypothetical protein
MIVSMNVHDLQKIRRKTVETFLDEIFLSNLSKDDMKELIKKLITLEQAILEG